MVETRGMVPTNEVKSTCNTTQNPYALVKSIKNTLT